MFCNQCNSDKSPDDFYASWKTRCKSCILKKQSSRSPEYVSWLSMRQRCNDKNCASYKDYGARGISVAEEWNDFSTFLADMGNRPSRAYSIERRNNHLGYSKSNCYWALKEDQNRNKRNNINLEFMGLRLPLRTWAIKVGLRPGTLYSRIKRYGWSIERALTQGVSDEWRNTV